MIKTRPLPKHAKVGRMLIARVGPRLLIYVYSLMGHGLLTDFMEIHLAFVEISRKMEEKNSNH